MVNTFLVYSDYEKSASCLDRARLGKQRVEAYQILCLCQDLTFLGQKQGDPLPETRGRARYDWVRRVAKRYKNSEIRYLVRNVDPEGINRTLYPIPTSIANQIPVGSKRGKKDIVLELENDGKFVIFPNDRVMKLGFCYHPAVLQWLGFEDSLKLYINAHIREFLARGYTNNMVLYTTFPSEVKHPDWVYSEEFHKNHRAALLKKERDRNEKPWYVLKQDFLDAGEFIDYIWPS